MDAFKLNMAALDKKYVGAVTNQKRHGNLIAIQM